MPFLFRGSILDSYMRKDSSSSPFSEDARLVSPFRYPHLHAGPVVSISLITGRSDIDGRKQLRLANVAVTSLQQGHCLFSGVWELRFDDGLAVYTHRLGAVDKRQLPFSLRIAENLVSSSII
jgi:hypothetical protein